MGGDFKADFDGQIAKLRIEKVYPEDEGEYTCVAYNELEKAVTSACLIVDSKYNIYFMKPILTKRSYYIARLRMLFHDFTLNQKAKNSFHGWVKLAI